MTGTSRYPMEHANDASVSEFICTDCDIDVFSLNAYVVWLPPRCGTCQWIAELPEAADREAVRRHVADIERLDCAAPRKGNG